MVRASRSAHIIKIPRAATPGIFYIIFKMTFEVLYEKNPCYSPTPFDDIRFLR